MSTEATLDTFLQSVLELKMQYEDGWTEPSKQMQPEFTPDNFPKSSYSYEDGQI